MSHLSGSESGACLVDPHSPWPMPLAPPTPLRTTPLCSPASQLLWQQASRVRASSATAPHLPDAGRNGSEPLRSDPRPPSFRCDRFARESEVDAHELAGFKRDDGNASTMATPPEIKARVAELIAAAAERTVVTVETIAKQLPSMTRAGPTTTTTFVRKHLDHLQRRRGLCSPALFPRSGRPPDPSLKLLRRHSSDDK